MSKKEVILKYKKAEASSQEETSEKQESAIKASEEVKSPAKEEKTAVKDSVTKEASKEEVKESKHTVAKEKAKKQHTAKKATEDSVIAQWAEARITGKSIKEVPLRTSNLNSIFISYASEVGCKSNWGLQESKELAFHDYYLSV